MPLPYFQTVGKVIEFKKSDKDQLNYFYLKKKLIIYFL